MKTLYAKNIKNSFYLKNMIKKESTQKHPFHLVDPSPWPLVASIGAFAMTSGGVLYMHKYAGGSRLFLTGFAITLYVMFTWWRDIVREGTFEGQHTVEVQKGLRLGMILFIVSEVMFFFAFFWAFFHSSLSPVFQIGGVWPPEAINTISAAGIPLSNTFYLLTSGVTVTWAHYAIILGDKEEAVRGLLATLFLATLFTAVQVFEYLEASFTISDSVYGSCFYMTTGFHGFHVFIGTCFLLVCTIRLVYNHFTKEHHFGFEAAAWYWHFVDVVWLFLFVTVYWWGSLGS